MRILVVSDTHGRHSGLEQAIEEAGKIDMLIHLGDVEGDEEYIDSLVHCEKHIVRGNNDFFTMLPGEEEFMIGGLRAFITHGHNYCVSLGPEAIKDEGIARGADVVMFGHTHRPYLDEGEEITVLNPGSLSYPRQPGREGSYVLMEIMPDESVIYTQKYLEER